MKKIVYGIEARKKIQDGINKLNDAVSITLGPKGRNVAIKNEYSIPTVVNDGVTIAKEVVLNDEIENMGAELLKEVALKTNDVAGDGTTTATLLGASIINDGIKSIESGASPVKIKSGMEKTLNEVINNIKKMSKNIESNDEIKEIATISAGDENVGKIISDAISMVGKEGIITIEDSKTTKTNLKLVEGIKLDSGYISSYMVGEMEDEETLENPYIFICNKKITSVQEILPLIEKVAKKSRPLLMIVEDIEGEALATLLVNKVRGSFNSIAVKAPSFGERRKEILIDIAVTTGTKVFEDDFLDDIENIDLEMLGSAKSVKVTKDNTIILGGNGNRDTIEKAINKIKGDIEKVTDTEEKENLRKRLSRLLGGVALIEVGAMTKTEQSEKKLRIEDALCATRAAIQEGITYGGGLTYIYAKRESEKFVSTLQKDEKIGGEILLNALEKPLYTIARNAGKNGDIVVEKVKNLDKGIGYDALNDDFVDMKKNGIIDPTKVARIALESAVSISSIVITTEVAMCDINEKDAS